MFRWYSQITAVERRTFWTCFGGWSLDALDVQMFSLVIPALIATWHVSNAEAGLVGGVTLVTSALGGWLGGALSDRIGRVRALQMTILVVRHRDVRRRFHAVTLGSCCSPRPSRASVSGPNGLAARCSWPRSSGLSTGARRSGRSRAAGRSAGAPRCCSTRRRSRGFPADIAWRVMFAIGLLPALLILYARRGIRSRIGPRSPGRSPGFLRRSSACSRRRRCG